MDGTALRVPLPTSEKSVAVISATRHAHTHRRLRSSLLWPQRIAQQEAQ